MGPALVVTFHTGIKHQSQQCEEEPAAPRGADLSTPPTVTPLLSGVGVLIQAELWPSLIGSATRDDS